MKDVEIKPVIAGHEDQIKKKKKVGDNKDVTVRWACVENDYENCDL